ncbi:MAG TPA: flagellar hook-associated protein FlgL, partial [Leptolinea sp.]
MRITNRMTLENQIEQMNASKELLDTYQEISSSGKQNQAISDDPGKASYILGLHSSLKVNETYTNTGESVSGWQSANEAAFSQLTDIATQANVLVTKGSPDTLSASERTAIGVQLDGLLKEAVNAANSNWGGKYIFSGFQTNKVPFSFNATQTAVDYNGDHGVMQQEISFGQKVDYGFDGSKVFSDFFTAMKNASTAMKNNDTSNLSLIHDDLAVATNT